MGIGVKRINHNDIREILDKMNLKLIPAKRYYEGGKLESGYVVIHFSEDFQYWKFNGLSFECANEPKKTSHFQWRECHLLANGFTQEKTLDKFWSNFKEYFNEG
jgi:hypothetical protein